jgi:hypothetical protein
MTRRRNRRRLAVAAILAVVSGMFIAGGLNSAADQPGKVDRNAAAQRLLKSPAARLLSAPAQAALHLQISQDRHLDVHAALQPRGPRASGGNAPPAPSFSNVPVNDPSTDTHQVDQTTQSETTIAVSGSSVVVGYNDSQQTGLAFTAGTDLTGYSYSTDGGASFTDAGTIPNQPEFVNFGDPWLATDRAGTFYYSTLAFDVFNFNLDIGVARSTDGGKTFTTAAPVLRPPFEIFYLGDKEAIAVGPDPSAKTRDNVYLAWDDISSNFITGESFTGLPVARSTDGGASYAITYADKFDLNKAVGCSFQQYLGAIPAVAKDGTLYVTAEKFTVDDPNCTFQVPVTRSEWIFRSTDGGQTFAAGVKIADTTESVPDGLLFLGPGRYMRNLELPTIAIRGSAVYVAWNEGAQGKSHVRLASSTDGGQTWSTSFATQGTGDEVQPAVSADNKGIHLLYYQRNKDNTLDVMVGNSTNGTSFVSKRVTTSSFGGSLTIPQFDPIIAFGYMGDYIANVSDGSRQYFAWGDNRNTVTNFLNPSGRNDPDVFFAVQ